MVVAAIFEERYWYPDDGGQVWIAGYTPVADDGRYLARDAPELAARGLRVASVAGARFQTAALEGDAAAPGRPLELRRDPGNEHDPNAVMVLAGGEQVGWVPRELAAEIAPQLDRGAAVVGRRRCASSAPRRATRAGASRCCSPRTEMYHSSHGDRRPHRARTRPPSGST